ncbi:MAG: hypothetical protein GF308_19695 [Candidatus Heimdallarchaeota archaeon]|nr:hypothetical protein [Candidatus Heimdallarchaeota archaeon]
MKLDKLSIITLSLIGLLFFIPIIQVKGYSVGDSYRYIVEDASGEFSYTVDSTTTEGSTEKFRVGNTPVSESDELEVKVTNKDSSSADFEIYDNSSQLLTSASTTSLGFALGLILYSLYPFILLDLSSGSVNPIDVDKGVSIGDSWYLAPPDVNWAGVFNTYNDSDSWSDTYSEWEDNEAELNAASGARYEDNGATIIFSLTVIGQYQVFADDTDLTITHSMSFHYNVNENNLKGYFMSTSINGDLEGEETTFSMVVRVKEKGYTRRVGLPFFGVIFSLIASSAVILAIAKKKK